MQTPRRAARALGAASRTALSNLRTIAEYACTEPTELISGLTLLVWAVTVDFGASGYYGWMRTGHLPLWQVVGGLLGLARAAAVTLRREDARLTTAALSSYFSVLCLVGFLLAGWRAAAGYHVIQAGLNVWVYVRLTGRAQRRRCDAAAAAPTETSKGAAR